MKKGAFSLLELIFILSIIGLLLVVAVPKITKFLTNTKNIKIKNDVLMIREGLNSAKNNFLLKGENEKLYSLDENDEELFSKILSRPIIASTSGEMGSWMKSSSNRYQVILQNSQKLEFFFDSDSYSFDCDNSDAFCREINQ